MVFINRRKQIEDEGMKNMDVEEKKDEREIIVDKRRLSRRGLE